ncbi:hypothetical protein J6590_033796 [Homalodisca vitripennis]|nr:hypothetical protein J6590_033796 [Homalodisca vitripennis]
MSTTISIATPITLQLVEICTLYTNLLPTRSPTPQQQPREHHNEVSRLPISGAPYRLVASSEHFNWPRDAVLTRFYHRHDLQLLNNSPTNTKREHHNEVSRLPISGAPYRLVASSKHFNWPRDAVLTRFYHRHDLQLLNNSPTNTKGEHHNEVSRLPISGAPYRLVASSEHFNWPRDAVLTRFYHRHDLQLLNNSPTNTKGEHHNEVSRLPISGAPYRLVASSKHFNWPRDAVLTRFYHRHDLQLLNNSP